jgi:hypothetical protein
MRTLLILTAAAALHCLLIWQASAQSQLNTVELMKAEQIDVAIDRLFKLKAAVAFAMPGRQQVAYKRIAVHSFVCASLYGMLSKTATPNSTPSSLTYSNVSAIMNLISGFIYPDPFENYKADIGAAQQSVLNLRKNNEQEKMIVALRICAALAEAEGRPLADIITELVRNP